MGLFWKLAACNTDVMFGNGAVTLRDTETVVEPLAPPAPWTTIEPRYKLPADKLAGFTDTLITSGAVPLVLLMESQLPPDVVDEVAV
jgi:hypothetical protein